MRVLEELWLRELCASHKNSIIRPETSFIFVIIYGINYTVCNLIAIFEAEVISINFYEQIQGIKWYVIKGIWIEYQWACFDISKRSNI